MKSNNQFFSLQFSLPIPFPKHLRHNDHGWHLHVTVSTGGSAEAVEGWHCTDSSRHINRRETETKTWAMPCCSVTLSWDLQLTDAALIQAKRPQVSVGQIRWKDDYVPYCLLSQWSWPWCAETERGPHSLRKWPTGNRTSVTQFLASFIAFLNSTYIW